MNQDIKAGRHIDKTIMPLPANIFQSKLVDCCSPEDSSLMFDLTLLPRVLSLEIMSETDMLFVRTDCSTSLL